MNCVSGSATQDRCTEVDDLAQTRDGIHAASGKTETTDFCRCFECEPKTDEWTKGKSEENTIGRFNSGDGMNAPPVPDHPVPALGGIEPAQWHTRSPAGLVAAGIAFEGESQIGSVRRRALLVGGDVRLGGEGNDVRKLFQRGKRSFGAGEFLLVKRIRSAELVAKWRSEERRVGK